MWVHAPHPLGQASPPDDAALTTSLLSPLTTTARPSPFTCHHISSEMVA